MTTFVKTADASFAGTSAADLIIVSLGAHAFGGTIAAGAGSDELRFTSTAAGDLLFVGDNFSGIDSVVIGTGVAVKAVTTGTAALDVDASAYGSGLSITGNNGDNFVVGTDFADTIEGGAGSDALYGGDGNDTFMVLGSQYPSLEVIDGEGGYDTLYVTSAGNFVLNADTFVERIGIFGGVAANIDASAIFNGDGVLITGGGGANTLIGSADGDTILGGTGADRLEGGEGNDVFLMESGLDLPVGEAVLGGDGFDQIRYTATIAGGTLRLTGQVSVESILVGSAAGSTSGTVALSVDASLAANPVDQLATGFEIIGNNGANVITGSRFDDTMIGGEGNDLFIELFSTQFGTLSDTLDDIAGGSGFDEIRFALTGFSSTNFLSLAGTSGVERAVIGTGTGATAVTTGTEALVIDASALNYGIELIGNAGGNKLTGGAGDDTLTGGGGTISDTLAGGAGNDVFVYRSTAEFTSDSIDGGSGVNTIRFSRVSGTGTLGQTLILSGVPTEVSRIELDPAATISGGIDAALLGGGGYHFAGNSVYSRIVATEQNDTMVAGIGAAEFFGRGGDDSLTGGITGDTLDGGAGSDTLDGGEAGDRYIYASGLDTEDTIADSGSSGTDTVFIRTASASIVLPESFSGIEALEIDGGGIVSFDATEYASGLRIIATASQGAQYTVLGTSYDDYLRVGSISSRETINGGAGNDIFNNPDRADLLQGGDGYDTVWIWPALGGGFTYVVPGTWFGIEAFTMTGLNGEPGTTYAANLRATGYMDNGLALTGNDAANQITGTRFDDTIEGSGGNDSLVGGPGNDRISGGPGGDAMNGGAGDDLFVDFGVGDRALGVTGTDTLELSGSGQTLDFTVIPNAAVRSVEVIDITGTGDNTLRLNFDDVRYNVGRNGTLRVDRDAGDTVDLAGTWSQTGSAGGYTTHQATRGGQTVYVQVEDTVAGGQHFIATIDPDTFGGTPGNDTITYGPGSHPSQDVIDGAEGTDILEVDGMTLFMGEGTSYSSLELVELRNGAVIHVDDEALAITAISGSNEAHLGGNAAQTYVGNAEVDEVHLDTAGQSVSTGLGADEVHTNVTELPGSTIDLGTDAGYLFLYGNGTADLTAAASVSGGLEISYVSGIDYLKLNNAGHTVVVNPDANATFNAGTVADNGGDDTFEFDAANWGGRDYTINYFEEGAGHDRIVLDLATFDGVFYGDANNGNYDDALPDDGLRNMVFNVDQDSLFIDYNRDGVWVSGDDLRILASGVIAFTEGTDLIFA